MSFQKRGKVKTKKQKTVYTTPTPTYKPKEDPKIGEPGSIDLDGIWIPQNYYGEYNQSKSYRESKIPKPEKGTLVTPLCRSLYSGKKYLSKAGSKSAENVFKKLCNDPEYIEFFKKMMDGSFNVSPRVRRAIRRYINFVYHTGNRRYTSDKYIKNPVEDYLTVDGVVKIKKVLKERENLLPEEQRIPSGVVLMKDMIEEDELDDRLGNSIQIGYIKEDIDYNYDEVGIQEL